MAKKIVNKLYLLWTMRLLCLAAMRNFSAVDFRRIIQQIGDSKTITNTVLIELNQLRQLNSREERIVIEGVSSIRHTILKPRTIHSTIRDLKDKLYKLSDEEKFIITGYKDAIKITCCFNDFALVRQVINDLDLTLFTFTAPYMKVGDPGSDKMNTVFFVA